MKVFFVNRAPGRYVTRVTYTSLSELQSPMQASGLPMDDGPHT